MANILNSRSSHTALLDSYLDRGCALAFTSADVNRGEDVDITTLLGSVTLKDSAYETQCHTPFGKGRLQGAEEGFPSPDFDAAVASTQCIEQPRQLLARTPYSGFRPVPSSFAPQVDTELEAASSVNHKDAKDFMSALKLLRNKYRKNFNPSPRCGSESSLTDHDLANQLPHPWRLRQPQLRKYDDHAHCYETESRPTADHSLRRRRSHHKSSSGGSDVCHSTSSPLTTTQFRNGAPASGMGNFPEAVCKLSAWKTHIMRVTPSSDAHIDKPHARCVLPGLHVGALGGNDVAWTPKLSSHSQCRRSPEPTCGFDGVVEDTTPGIPVTPLTDSLRDFFTRQAVLLSSMETPTPQISQNGWRSAGSTPSAEDTVGGKFEPSHSSKECITEMGFPEQITSAIQHTSRPSPLHDGLCCVATDDDSIDLRNGADDVRRLYPGLFHCGRETLQVGTNHSNEKQEVQMCAPTCEGPRQLHLDASTIMREVCDQGEPGCTQDQPMSIDCQKGCHSELNDLSLADSHEHYTAQRNTESFALAERRIRDGQGEFRLPGVCVSGLSGRANKILQRTRRSALHKLEDVIQWNVPASREVASACHDPNPSVKSLLQRAGISQHTIDMVISSQG